MSAPSEAPILSPVVAVAEALQAHAGTGVAALWWRWGPDDDPHDPAFGGVAYPGGAEALPHLRGAFVPWAGTVAACLAFGEPRMLTARFDPPVRAADRARTSALPRGVLRAALRRFETDVLVRAGADPRLAGDGELHVTASPTVPATRLDDGRGAVLGLGSAEAGRLRDALGGWLEGLVRLDLTFAVRRVSAHERLAIGRALRGAGTEPAGREAEGRR